MTVPCRALATLALLHAGATFAAQPALRAYAALGVEAVHLRHGVRVTPGAVGAVNGDVRLGGATRIRGGVAADRVRVGRDVIVRGGLFCRLVTGGQFGLGVVGGPSVQGSLVPGCETLATPVVDVTQIAVAPVVPGTEDIVVPRRTGTAPVASGRYGAVTVGAGSLLQLAGGAYDVRSIRLARRARMVCLAECRIAVLEDIVLRARAQLGAGTGLRARGVRVDVAAADGAALRTGPEAVLAATVVAPGGDVRLGRRGSYRGAYVGRSVVVGRDARVRGDSAL